MKQIKKSIALLLTLVLLFSAAPLALAAEPDVTVTLNGTVIEFDVPAQLINDRTMVPMRKIFETLGSSVEWIEAEQGIVAARGSSIIIMQIGAPMMVIADLAAGTETRIPLDVPPQIVHSRTLVPIRAISESLGIQVDWDADTWTVLLTT